MILVDFTNLVYRSLFSAIWINKSENSLNNLAEYKGILMHILLTSLKYTEANFGKEYGKVILCYDYPYSWRKNFYPDYKVGRKTSSDINWDEFFSFFNNELKVEFTSLPYANVEVKYAEADDLIAVFSKSLKGPHIIISEDKDFIQLLNNGVKLYRPIKQEFVDIPEKGVEWFLRYHICLGDKVDNILSIKDNTIFTPEFKEYLNSVNGGDKITPINIKNNLYIVKEYKEKYGGDIPIFKNGGFGPKTCEKFLENFEENMEKNPYMAERFKENQILIDLNYIPAELKKEILNTKLNFESDSSKILNIYKKYKLNKLMNDDMKNITEIFNDWI